MTFLFAGACTLAVKTTDVNHLNVKSFFFRVFHWVETLWFIIFVWAKKKYLSSWWLQTRSVYKLHFEKRPILTIGKQPYSCINKSLDVSMNFCICKHHSTPVYHIRHNWDLNFIATWIFSSICNHNRCRSVSIFILYFFH